MDAKSTNAVYLLVGVCVLTLIICVVVWWQRGGSDPQPLPEPVPVVAPELDGSSE